MSEVHYDNDPSPPSHEGGGDNTAKKTNENLNDLDTESFIEMVDNALRTSSSGTDSTLNEGYLSNTFKKDEEELSDEERMLLYEKAMHFKRLGSLNHSLLCFLGCLQGLQPSCKSKFTMLPQCLTHIAQIYAHSEDYQKAVEFMQAAKLYYEVAIIEAGIQVDEYKKETDSAYRPLDLDPCLDEAKRANEYEKLSYSCLQHEKFQLALDYCGKATKLRQQVYGDDHPITSKSLDLFTLIYAEMGKCQYGEALQKYGDLTKVIEEEEKEKTTEEKELTDDVVMEEEVEAVKEELLTTTDILPVETDPILDNGIFNREGVKDITQEPHVVNADNSIEQRSEEVLCKNLDCKKANEQTVRLVTPFQLMIMFIISALMSLLITWVWCYYSGSDSCPTKHYIYATLKYWYYVYLVPSAVDDKFY